ncbi:MAG: VOC family protein [Nocardioides sp.]|nr:VOC family protein [Nocardioides sp.]
MSERDTYPAGVPCWVTNLQHDVPAATAFYEALFGWETESGPPDEAPYALGRLRGRDVAGIGTMPEPDATPAWVMEVRVEDLPATVRAVRDAGGQVLREGADFGPVGRLGAFVDPQGAVFCAWETGTREGAQLVNEPGAWSMNALRTPDPEPAAAFYGAVFGWNTEPFGPASLFRLPGYVGGEPSQPVPRDVVAVMMPSPEGTPTAWGTDFWVSDADDAAATVERMGGHVLQGPYDAPPFRQAVVADCGGAVFSVSELRPDQLPG